MTFQTGSQVDKSVLMVFLGIGQFAQEFAYAGRRNDISGFSIKAACFRFHNHCCDERTLRLQYPVEPDGSALNEPFYILSTDERNMVTKFEFVCLE